MVSTAQASMLTDSVRASSFKIFDPATGLSLNQRDVYGSTASRNRHARRVIRCRLNDEAVMGISRRNVRLSRFVKNGLIVASALAATNSYLLAPENQETKHRRDVKWP